ncbi:MAG TPA: alkyl hydroperoxide reductase [Gemmataceae bacterium]|nr:alkyl hydroperoxide reductase [Gemmataceae bacterium]
MEQPRTAAGRGTPLIARRRFHRGVFLAAGLYNLGWGLFTALDPQWLFRFASMPLQNYPEIFACLGMVVGLYGILYLEVARVPERGWLLAAVGLLGKILGPLGWLQLVGSGQWPVTTLVLCVTNDLIWWIPFGLYLYDAWPARSHD